MTALPTNPYPRSGPARGLIGRVRSGDVFDDGRALCSYRWGVPRTGGTCRWCRNPTASKRLSWHTECIQWYAIAKGVTVYPGTRMPLVRSQAEIDAYHERRAERHRRYLDSQEVEDLPPLVGDCEMCGGREGGIEIDHRVALGVARRMRTRGDRRWWRAWTPANLRPLCHACHAQKTKSDRQIMRLLDAGVEPELALRGESTQMRFAI